MKQDDRTYMPYVCHFCGKIIGYEGYEHIETKRKTHIWMHKRCVPKGRSEQNAACDR